MSDNDTLIHVAIWSEMVAWRSLKILARHFSWCVTPQGRDWLD